MLRTYSLRPRGHDGPRLPSHPAPTMIFYNSLGSNPRIVRVFAAERGVTLHKVEIDTRSGENRQPAYLAKNPMGQTPALEFDDGSVLTEIAALCEYLDARRTATCGTSLFGSNALERAQTRMWTRRVDLNIAEPMLGGIRYADALARFQTRMRCIPQAAADLKLLAQDKLAMLDAQMAGHSWLCGERFSFAVIFVFGMLDIAASVGQPLNSAFGNVCANHGRMKARASAGA